MADDDWRTKASEGTEQMRPRLPLVHALAGSTPQARSGDHGVSTASLDDASVLIPFYVSRTDHGGWRMPTSGQASAVKEHRLIGGDCCEGCGSHRHPPVGRRSSRRSFRELRQVILLLWLQLLLQLVLLLKLWLLLVLELELLLLLTVAAVA